MDGNHPIEGYTIGYMAFPIPPKDLSLEYHFHPPSRRTAAT